MTKLELARHHVTAYSLHVDFPTESTKFDTAFGELLAETGQHSLVRFVDTYRRRKAYISVELLLGRIRENQYHFHITYDAETKPVKVSLQPKAVQGLQRGYDILALIDGLHVLQAEMLLNYEARKFFNVVHLPIKLSSAGQGESVFDEIRGMRLVKYGPDDKLKYTSVVDYPSLDELNNIVRYSYASRFTEEGIQHAFDSGVQVSKLFVRPQPTNRVE
jgi:hypothetical protein